MKRTTILLTVLCFAAVTFAHVASAQAPKAAAGAQKSFNVAGNWDVIVRMPTGNVNEKWTVKQVGDKISGSVKGANGDAPVMGDIVTKVFFRVSVKDGDAEKLIRATINDNNSMDGSITIGRAEYLWSANRAK